MKENNVGAFAFVFSKSITGVS